MTAYNVYSKGVESLITKKEIEKIFKKELCNINYCYDNNDFKVLFELIFNKLFDYHKTKISKTVNYKQVVNLILDLIINNISGYITLLPIDLKPLIIYFLQLSPENELILNTLYDFYTSNIYNVLINYNGSEYYQYTIENDTDEVLDQLFVPPPSLLENFKTTFYKKSVNTTLTEVPITGFIEALIGRPLFRFF
jgi:hypothetical protein